MTDRAHARRHLATLVLIASALSGCGLASAPGLPHPACLGHPDPGDCQAAVAAAMPDLPALTDPNYVVTVEPIKCDQATCSTWIEGTPREGCLPSWSFEMTRPRSGTWSVSMMSHGDPPCVFEP
jgi:hypothetical protein